MFGYPGHREEGVICPQFPYGRLGVPGDGADHRDGEFFRGQFFEQNFKALFDEQVYAGGQFFPDISLADIRNL